MKYKNLLFLILFASCGSEEEIPETGFFELQFDQSVAGKNAGILSDPLDTSYPYTNAIGQSYNLTLVKYIISKIILEGPNGEYFVDEQVVSRDETSGYYLIDDSNISSQRINLQGIPPGTYDKVSFTLGVEEEGVEQGTGIFISDMFWTWNTGYIALKVEGQSPDSPGEAFGDSIEETNPFGFSYHIGGWNEPNNNQQYTLEFEPLMVEPGFEPNAHIVLDINRIFEGANPVDFSTNNSVHSPAAGVSIAKNLDNIFIIDHVHQ